MVADLVAQGIVPILLGIVGYLLIDLRTSVKEKLSQHDDAIQALQDAHTDLLAELPIQYVRREEYVRQAVQIDRKLDRISEKLDRARSSKGGASESE